MRFQGVNEAGTVERVNEAKPIFRFKYTSKFYGSCTFTAKVTQRGHEPLIFEDRSVILEESDSRRGNSSALLNMAKTFFKQVLSEIRTREELEPKMRIWDRIRRRVYK